MGIVLKRLEYYAGLYVMVQIVTAPFCALSPFWEQSFRPTTTKQAVV